MTGRISDESHKKGRGLRTQRVQEYYNDTSVLPKSKHTPASGHILHHWKTHAVLTPLLTTARGAELRRPGASLSANPAIEVDMPGNGA